MSLFSADWLWRTCNDLKELLTMHKSSSACFEMDTRKSLKNVNCTASLDCSQNSFWSALLHFNFASCILISQYRTLSLNKQKLGNNVNSRGTAAFIHTYTSVLVLTLLVFVYPQGCPEIESVFQEEEAAPCAPCGMWSTTLSHQLQRHPAGVSAPCSALPFTGSQQSQRHSWNGQGMLFSNVAESSGSGFCWVSFSPTYEHI